MVIRRTRPAEGFASDYNAVCAIGTVWPPTAVTESDVMLPITARSCLVGSCLMFLLGGPVAVHPTNASTPDVSSWTTAAAAAEPVKVAGVWKFTVELEVGTGHPTVTLKQDGEKLTGTYDGRYGPAPLEGTIKDNKIEFTVSMIAEGAAVTGVFSGVIEGEGERQGMHGAVDFDQAGEGTWSAVKAPPK